LWVGGWGFWAPYLLVLDHVSLPQHLDCHPIAACFVPGNMPRSISDDPETACEIFGSRPGEYWMNGSMNG
jgi:hypothetical protein